MTDDRGDERDPDTGAFDPDEWFRTQFAPPPPEPGAPPPGGAPATFSPPPALVEPPPTMPAMLPPTMPAVLEPAMPAVLEPAPTQPSEIIVPGTPTGDAISPGDAATELIREPEPGGALDELFGNESFQEYNEPLIPAAPRSPRRAVRDGTARDGTGGVGTGGDGTGGGGTGGDATALGEATPRAPLGRTQKTLLWVAGSLVAVLVLVLIFVFGTRIPLLLGPAPGAEPSPTPTPTPTPTLTERPVGPVEAGDYRWHEIWGGECLEPFVDAWQDEYTVVDCAEPHAAQLAARTPFPLPEGSEVPGSFPGQEALAAQISLLCSRPGVLDLVAAAQFTDIQVQGAFAVTEQQWNEGMTDFFCFVSRASGEPLTGSIIPVG